MTTEEIEESRKHKPDCKCNLCDRVRKFVEEIRKVLR